MRYNNADYLMDDSGSYGSYSDLSPISGDMPSTGGGYNERQTTGSGRKTTSSKPKKKTTSKPKNTGSVNQRRTTGGYSGGTSGGTIGGGDPDNYGHQDHETGIPGFSGPGGSTPMSDMDPYDPEGYGGYGTPTTGMPEYHPERGPFPQTPTGPMRPTYPDPSPPLNPPMDVPHFLPPFPPMNLPPFPPMPPQLPEINFKPMEMPERKPYGFASVDSRAAGYSENLPGAGTLRDRVLGTVGRSPLKDALQ